MAKANRRPPGTQDILPKDSTLWRYVESVAAETAMLYGYREIRVPTFEPTEVFTGSVGESSDIVQKEMYTVSSKGEDTFTLRPEFTAGIVRAAIENGLFNDALPLKVFTSGSAFRHEKQQKGRFREFHQFDVECFGSDSPASDAEIILLVRDILSKLGIEEIALKLNAIGCPQCRPAYLEALTSYFTAHEAELDDDSKRRLVTNPMRILDSKIQTTIALGENAPKTTDHLCPACATHFAAVQDYLALLEMPFTLDPKLVRGLDYYTNTVFEFVSNNIGSQGTICGGGRYNLLVERRGGKPTPSLGFAFGIERVLLELAALEDPVLPEEETCDIYLAAIGDLPAKKAFQLASQLRDEGFGAAYDMMGRGLKSQMKYADKIGAKYVMVIGDNELLSGIAKLKNMATGEEEEVPLNDALVDHLYNTQVANALADMEMDVTGWGENGGAPNLRFLRGISPEETTDEE